MLKLRKRPSACRGAFFVAVDLATSAYAKYAVSASIALRLALHNFISARTFMLKLHNRPSACRGAFFVAVDLATSAYAKYAVSASIALHNFIFARSFVRTLWRAYSYPITTKAPHTRRFSFAKPSLLCKPCKKCNIFYIETRNAMSISLKCNLQPPSFLL